MFGLGSTLVSMASSAINVVGSAIGSACSAIGGAVVSAGRLIVDTLKHELPMLVQICNIAFTVGKEIGVFSPNHTEQDMYELGMRAEQSIEEGVNSEQFENNKDYIDHLREKIVLDKESMEKLDSLSDTDKLKYASLGSAITIAAITEQYKIDIPETFWLASINSGVQVDQFKPMLDVFESERVKPDLDGFIKGELPSELQRTIYDVIDTKLEELLDDATIDRLLS